MIFGPLLEALQGDGCQCNWVVVIQTHDPWFPEDWNYVGYFECVGTTDCLR